MKLVNPSLRFISLLYAVSALRLSYSLPESLTEILGALLAPCWFGLPTLGAPAGAPPMLGAR
jgi:hypothetical protein